GSIEIRSPNALTAPAIKPNSLSTDHDVREMLEGSKLLRRLAAAPAFAGIIAAEIQPGPAAQTDQDLIDDIRQRCSTVFHPVSTCRMGSGGADNVVDVELKVHGLRGMRVVDASVFPTVTSGNTNAPVIMTAEKAADFVLRDARQTPDLGA
ncbi:MAG: choline dehydrogenase, partial [Alphaproteobacteria bacterium]|nr:choline dehydrogenase [Alphaproteobacteria bacterium]